MQQLLLKKKLSVAIIYSYRFSVMLLLVAVHFAHSACKRIPTKTTSVATARLTDQFYRIGTQKKASTAIVIAKDANAVFLLSVGNAWPCDKKSKDIYTFSLCHSLIDEDLFIASATTTSPIRINRDTISVRASTTLAPSEADFSDLHIQILSLPPNILEQPAISYLNIGPTLRDHQRIDLDDGSQFYVAQPSNALPHLTLIHQLGIPSTQRALNMGYILQLITTMKITLPLRKIIFESQRAGLHYQSKYHLVAPLIENDIATHTRKPTVTVQQRRLSPVPTDEGCRIRK